jgi:CxxC-x17-CxxC domain-containing protein
MGFNTPLLLWGFNTLEVLFMLEIICATCQKSFSMSDEEIAYFEKMGYQNRKHCSECAAKRRAEKSAPKQMVTITCSKCGQQAQVPSPTMTLCRDCFVANKR